MKITLAATVGLIALTGLAAAIVSSYGSISGYATVQSAISWDVLESYSDVDNSRTNDTHYQLESTYQGETKWLKIKISNAADTPINISLTVSVLPGSAGGAGDVALTVWDADRNATLTNPILIPTSDLYLWIEHAFSSSAIPSSYEFALDIAPA
jgi:hypothetical protein